MGVTQVSEKSTRIPERRRSRGDRLWKCGLPVPLAATGA